jgi:hypothetical protein
MCSACIANCVVVKAATQRHAPAQQTENNYKLFERDLGEGRRLVPERDQVKDSAPGRLPAPLPFRNAERATPNMKVRRCAS